MLLNPSSSEKPITKKEACDILNIAYNTTRLTKIIEDYEETKAYVKKRKQGLRGRPASDAEIALACENYLGGDTITDISKLLFRVPPGLYEEFLKGLESRKDPQEKTKD